MISKSVVLKRPSMSHLPIPLHYCLRKLLLLICLDSSEEEVDGEGILVGHARSTLTALGFTFSVVPEMRPVGVGNTEGYAGPSGPESEDEEGVHVWCWRLNTGFGYRWLVTSLWLY